MTITQETVEQRKARESRQHDYNIVKRLGDNYYIVRRKSDGTQLLGHPWDIHQTDPAFSALMERGAKRAVATLLNHPNLLNAIETQVDYPFRGTSTQVASQQSMLLWDFCDAGTLEALLKEPPVGYVKDLVTQKVKHFLPEGLCWHVVLSMLKALAWLHEGHREEDYVDWTAAGTAERATRWWTLDPDWMPILHRDIRPENIFFQHPRGTETYGLCKLGNFHKCFVSGHVNYRSGGQVVTVEDGDEKLEVLRKTMAVDNIYTIPRRHWDRGSTPPAGFSGRCHKYFDVKDRGDELSGYSSHLRETLKELLCNYRAGLNEQAFTAVGLLKTARWRYLQWKNNHPDGKLHRDTYDDELQRQINKKKKMRADSAQAHAQSGPGAIDISARETAV
ncbi:hypothetical protein SLS53_001510 [Cytospora paraplurivora]|uniref:non-specific serine/threonine protein kinase n=1 Tax=Cytospora paraplurivora TaxID=2898453 RepID=A0AAN9YLJ0_9PEZI